MNSWFQAYTSFQIYSQICEASLNPGFLQALLCVVCVDVWVVQDGADSGCGDNHQAPQLRTEFWAFRHRSQLDQLRHMELLQDCEYIQAIAIERRFHLLFQPTVASPHAEANFEG